MSASIIMNMIYKEIQNTIENAQNILLTAHEKPDGDALGSVFAISSYLKHLDKNFRIFLKNYNNYYDHLSFLNFDILEENNVFWKKIDLIISLDSSDLLRTGLEDVDKEIIKNVPIINIDHHKSNEGFGFLNLIDPKASSTTVILNNFFKKINFNFDAKTATGLLLGVLTDTDNFSNKGTNLESFKVASELLKKGANIAKINYSNKKDDNETLKFLGNVFQKLEKNDKMKIAYTVISKNEMERAEKNGLTDKIETLPNFFNNLDDSNIAMVLKEKDDYVKVSLRSTKNDIDVSRIAKWFGGGGHKGAAGFAIKGSLLKTKKGWRIV